MRENPFYSSNVPPSAVSIPPLAGCISAIVQLPRPRCSNVESGTNKASDYVAGFRPIAHHRARLHKRHPPRSAPPAPSSPLAVPKGTTLVSRTAQTIDSEPSLPSQTFAAVVSCDANDVTGNRYCRAVGQSHILAACCPVQPSDLGQLRCSKKASHARSSVRVCKKLSRCARDSTPATRPLETTGSWLRSWRPIISSALISGVSGVTVRI